LGLDGRTIISSAYTSFISGGRNSETLKIRVELTEEAVNLADSYLAENVVGTTSRSDCFHIVMATINEVDILVSWSRYPSG